MAQSADKRDLRREEILEAAWAVFAAKGYADTTMLEIARSARASKETLYAWFGSKEKLFESLLLERLKNIGSTLATEAGPDWQPERVLYLIARDLLRFVSSPGTMALLRVATANARLFPQINRALAQSLSRKDFAQGFEAWRARGLMEFDNAEEMASLFVAMAQGEWATRLSYGLIDTLSDEQIDHHARLVTRLFLRAVAPSK